MEPLKYLAAFFIQKNIFVTENRQNHETKYSKHVKKSIRDEELLFVNQPSVSLGSTYNWVVKFDLLVEVLVSDSFLFLWISRKSTFRNRSRFLQDVNLFLEIWLFLVDWWPEVIRLKWLVSCYSTNVWYYPTKH